MSARRCGSGRTATARTKPPYAPTPSAGSTTCRGRSRPSRLSTIGYLGLVCAAGLGWRRTGSTGLDYCHCRRVGVAGNSGMRADCHGADGQLRAAFEDYRAPPHVEEGHQESRNELLRGGLVPVASGMARHAGQSAIRIKNRYAALHAARLQPGESVELPDAPFQHLFIPRGAVTLEGSGALAQGDAVRFTATGGQKVTASEPAEILLREMHATLAEG